MKETNISVDAIFLQYNKYIGCYGKRSRFQLAKLMQHYNPLTQWFSNFLHQVPPQKIFGFPSTTIMTNIKMQYKWLPTAPGVCVCVCVFTAVCVCTLDGLNAEHKFRVCHVTFTFSSTIHSKKKTSQV